MAKSLLSRHDLEHAILLQIRSCYGCEDVTAVILHDIADPRVTSNWGISALHRHSDAERNADLGKYNGRAIARVQERLRSLYNLEEN